MKNKILILIFSLSLLSQGCYTIEESMFFQPVKLERLSSDYKFHDVYFSVEDSISLNGWYLTKENSDAIILLLHGNTRNLYSYPWTNIINSLSKLNADVFAIDYRGYGRSTGEPSFKGIYQDAEGALDYLEKHNPENKPIIIYGLSMGSIPAVKVATRKGVSGLILEGLISSTKDFVAATKSHFWFLYFIKIKYDKDLEFDNSLEIQKVKCPILIIHGKHDNLPESMSLKLYNSISHNTKQYWLVEKGTHCDTYKVEPEEYINKLSNFIKKCIAKK
jgi:fermentation-respiration switch protein FrsA (DUF1100 family)